MATRFLKKWAGLANTSLLYLPKRGGGLNLSPSSSLYQRLQVLKQCQLLTSTDPTVRAIAERNLKTESENQRSKFRPAVMVQKTMEEDPSRTRQSLRTASVRRLRLEEEESRLETLKSLPRQGQMMSIATPDAASIWGKAINRPSSLCSMRLTILSHTTVTSISGRSTPPATARSATNLTRNVLNNCKVALEMTV